MDDSIGILRQMLAGHEKHAALAEATGSREAEYHRNRCRALQAAIAALDAPPVMYVTHEGKHGEYSPAQTSEARDADVICIGSDSVVWHTHPDYGNGLFFTEDAIMDAGQDSTKVDELVAAGRLYQEAMDGTHSLQQRVFAAKRFDKALAAMRQEAGQT